MVPSESNRTKKRNGFPAGEHLSGTVYVVDDDVSFRTAIKRHLEKIGYLVIAYASAEQLLEQRPDENEKGCILLDVRMPGLNGLALHSRLLELGSMLPIVFLTGYVDVTAIVTAIKEGAEDFLVKPIKSDELVGAIERALARHQAALETKRQVDALRGRLAKLTPRERQVFVLIVRGRMNKQIAHELGATERTIKAHRRSVMEKMKAGSLIELVSIGERLGILRR
ncbi:response regulator [Bradyrhizobium sp. STM 3843]|uniref:response regulator transcription factor n=1 Tax=Bradyrhizobium sp. STM 3843 TaxID=551947 RepID=UPI001FCC1E3C|nr:response regulator [Bradyrhizobium sp. STM 3843]